MIITRTCRVLLLLLSFLMTLSTSFAWELERRTPQFNDDFSYAILPLPYSIPGIGSGFGVAAGAVNIGGSYMDTYGIWINGDVEGRAIGFSDIHLISENLILDFGYSKISKAAFGLNNSRGMEGDEDPDDFKVAELTDSIYYGGQLTLSFSERRLEFSVQHYKAGSRVERIRDSEGNVIAEIDDPETEIVATTNASAILDLTDDRFDPRSGFRVKVSRDFPRDVEEDQVKYYTVDTNVTAYIPLLRNSTWVFNYFQSDAVVVKEGETDREQVGNEFSCTSGDTVCETEKENTKDQIVAQNKYGSASSLGGNSRLRSFVSTRYRGAHTRFYGTEFRWNLTDENARFNIWFMEDLRTSVQLAFFHEVGSIADKTEDLFKESRHSTGIGVRTVMGSGLVYRLDYSTGEEGAQTVLFFGYPWDFL